MPPAASDDLFRQQSDSPGDNSPPQDQFQPIPEHGPISTRNKKKAAKAAKLKAARAAARTPPEDLIDPSPPLQVEPSSCPNPSLEHHGNNNIVSPVLDALGSLEETPDNDIAYRTDTWAKSIPFGKSPPNDVLDGELAGGSPLSFPTAQERVGGFSHPSSASPPSRRRPLSYGNGYLSSQLSRQQSTDRHKSNSVSSPFSNPIPPPHMPQAHFYGAPDIDLQVSSGQNHPQTEGNYSFCAFDTIMSQSSKTSRMGGTVLLTGTDGGLEVLAIEERKTRLIGKLIGLNGRVIEAKMLTCNLPNDPFVSTRPHVALVIHGPCAPSDDEGRTSSAGSEINETPLVNGRHEKRSNDTKFYQTRVEVYSLRTAALITTLFATQPTPCYENIPGLPTFAPAPIGNLKVYVSNNHIVLASGVSGEVYIFGVDPLASESYRCLGKTWTSIQSKEARRYSTSSGSTDPDGSRNDSPRESTNSENVILSVRGRWMAIVPPSTSFRPSLRGNVPAALVQGKVFGLETRNPPVRPAVNCATDVGEGESLFDKVARGVTQELVRGARWMGDQGLQAWNTYWNKDQHMGTRRSSNLLDSPQQGHNAFPPTHAQDTQAATPTEPDFVSIIDLKRLEENGEAKNAMFNPVATFQVPNGCSFLSFSPNGLMLLTASRKGDVQYVWDMMQAKYCRAGAFLSDDISNPSANVRQIARYARLTTSSIADVIWTTPLGDRLAIITRKGTVHVFDMPRGAFQWPPFRRARPPPKPQSPDSPAEDIPDRSNGGNPLSAAIKLVGGKTQPILSAVRGRTTSAGHAFTAANGFGISSAAGVRGGKVVAAGLSKSMGAATGTVNTLRHVGENRLHLPGLARDPTASRVTWISNKGQPFLGLVDNGSFRLYRIKRTVPTHKNKPSQSVIGGKEIEYKLPANLQTPCGPIPLGFSNPETTVSATLALPSSNPQSYIASKSRCQPLSQAEIETNAPYQPFHTDQRVNLYIFSAESEANDSLMPPPTSQWVFGDDISMSKLHVRPLSAGGNDDDDNETIHGQHPGLVGEMENLISLGNSSGNVEEVVITTRRKKRTSSQYPSTASGADVDDGFFEDDCEVLDFARDRV